jgi:hypothetical protein
MADIFDRIIQFLPEEDRKAIAASRQTGPKYIDDRPSEVEVEAIADRYVAEQAAAEEVVPPVKEPPVEEPPVEEPGSADTGSVVTSNNVTSDETVVENGRLLVYSITRDANGNIVSRTFL